MKKRPMILTVVMLACASVLFAAGAIAPEQSRSVPSEPQPLDVFAVAAQPSLNTDPIPVPSDCICPQYPYAYYPDYWSYYAIRRSDCRPGSLNAAPNLPSTPCPGCYGTPPGDCPGSCVIVSGSGFATASATQMSASHLGSGYHVMNVTKNGEAGIGKTGFARKRTRKYEIRLNKTIATKKADFVVKIVPKTGQPFLAKLVLVSIDPQRIPNLPKKFSHLRVRTEGVGFEIDESASTPVESGNVLTEQSGNMVAIPEQPHCYLVRHGEVWYHVLCHASHAR